MTRILYERTGGFMGRKVSLSLNLDELPASQSSALETLLDQADFFNLPENLVSRPMPDEFTYTITVIAKTQHHSVHLSETTVPDSLRSLLDDLSKRARASQRK